MIGNVSIIVRQPWGNERAVLGVRTALAAQTGGYQTNLVLLGDGVWNLTGTRPAYLDQLITQFLENEGRLICLDQDLETRTLTPGDLTLRPEIAGTVALAELMDETDSVNLY